MKEKTSKRLIILLIGIILWIIFICDHAMSTYGIYTIFNYNTHEVISAFPILCLIFTIVWLIFTISKSFKNKQFKSNMFFCSVLFIILISQIVYLYDYSQEMTTSTVVRIESIDTAKEEIIVDMSGHKMTLKYPMLSESILNVESDEYLITYKCNKKTPSRGILCDIDLCK